MVLLKINEEKVKFVEAVGGFSLGLVRGGTLTMMKGGKCVVGMDVENRLLMWRFAGKQEDLVVAFK